MNKIFLRHIPIIGHLIVFLTLFLLGTFYDKQFSELFNVQGYEHNFFGVFIEIFGFAFFVIPMMVIITVAYNWFLFSKIKTKTRDRIQNWHLITFWAIILAILTIVASIPVMSQHTKSYELLIWFLSILIYWALFAYIFWFFNKKDQRQKFINQEYCLQTLLMMVIFIISILIVATLLKIIFQRPRPEATLPPGSLEQYREWWNVSYQNFSFQKQSFPSGHVASATTLLAILFLSQKRNWKWRSLAVIIMLAIVIVTLGRIVFLKHFITDVVMTMILAFILYTISARFLNKNWLKKWEVSYG